jgi:hypothetical protein
MIRDVREEAEYGLHKYNVELNTQIPQYSYLDKYSLCRLVDDPSISDRPFPVNNDHQPLTKRGQSKDSTQGWVLS